MANSNRLESLDTFRAFLAWTVVAVHAAWISGIQGPGQNGVGVMAVEGFIVMSGYVITGLLIQKRESYRVFITRRFFRLFPAFAVVIVLVVLSWPLTHGVVKSAIEGQVSDSETRAFWAHLAAHLTLLHGVIPSSVLPWSQFAFVGPGWSISLEWQLYLVAPLLVWYLARTGLLGACFLLGLSGLMLEPKVAAALSSVWEGAGGFLPQRFFFFLVGALLYLGIGSRPPGPASALYRFPRWSRSLGEVSYSTYLVHYPILVLMARVVRLEDQYWRAGVLFVVAAPVIIAASFLLYRWIETPGIALGRAITGKRWKSLNGSKDQLACQPKQGESGAEVGVAQPAASE